MAAPIVRDHMTPNPITVEPTCTVAKAHRLMQEHGVRHLPVVGEKGLVGIITRGDILEASASETGRLNLFNMNDPWTTTSVEELMTPDPVTIGPDTTVLEAADLMFQHDIGSLPVVEGDHVIGIITETDIFHLVVRMLAERKQEEEELE
jgi:acetoin utilization protein AcuB